MEFCKQCKNMYYIKLKSEEDNNKLTYYCRNCGFEYDNIQQSNICVSKTKFKKKTQSFNHIINEYTKLGPTIPRVYNMECPNADCKTNKDNASKEVLYIRYDDENMKYVYMCCICDFIWKNEER